MTKIRAVQTGKVKVKASDVQASGSVLSQMFKTLFSREWSDWLPIYAWVIEHPEGVFLVDTGETARTGEKGYLPFFARLVVRFDVQPEDEIGPQLVRLGIQPNVVKKIVLTHLHTDHSGGLHHFPHSEVFVDATEYDAATGLSGRMSGYRPHRWPQGFKPAPLEFEDTPLGPFSRSCKMTDDGHIIVVPTPGHSPGHVSVVVKAGDLNYLLAGDVSYTPETVKAGAPFGTHNSQTEQTLRNIQQFAQEHPTVYLAPHDPEVAARLASRQVLYR